MITCSFTEFCQRPVTRNGRCARHQPEPADGGWAGTIAGGVWALLTLGIAISWLRDGLPLGGWTLLANWWVIPGCIGLLLGIPVLLYALWRFWGWPALCSFGNWLGRP